MAKTNKQTPGMNHVISGSIGTYEPGDISPICPNMLPCGVCMLTNKMCPKHWGPCEPNTIQDPIRWERQDPDIMLFGQTKCGTKISGTKITN